MTTKIGELTGRQCVCPDRRERAGLARRRREAKDMVDREMRVYTIWEAAAVDPGADVRDTAHIADQRDRAAEALVRALVTAARLYPRGGLEQLGLLHAATGVEALRRAGNLPVYRTAIAAVSQLGSAVRT